MNYVKPPILEAVYQITFQDLIEEKSVSKISEKLGTKFETRKARNEIEVIIDSQTSETTTNVQAAGVEFRDESGTKIVVLTTKNFLYGELAPYSGWDVFESQIIECTSVVRNSARSSRICRIGVRFINRIDVPFDDSGLAHTEAYVRVEPSRFEFGPNTYNRFLVQFARDLPTAGMAFNLSCASVESPVPGYSGLLLDIDAYWIGSVAFRLDEIVSKLRLLRKYKNEVFEAAITDDARQVFEVVQ